MGRVFDKRLKTLRFCRAETRMYLPHAPVRPPRGQRFALADVWFGVLRHAGSTQEQSPQSAASSPWRKGKGKALHSFSPHSPTSLIGRLDRPIQGGMRGGSWPAALDPPVKPSDEEGERWGVTTQAWSHADIWTQPARGER